MAAFSIQIYKGRKRLRQAWRWRAVAANGRVIANGGEAYTNVADIETLLVELFGANGDIPVRVLE